MRILFISHTNIGDAVLSTILLHRMVHDHPDAVVDIACGAKSVELFKGLPQLGILMPIVKKKNHGHHFDMWKMFRTYTYDYVVDFRGSLLPWFLRKKKVIRFSNNNKKLHKAQQICSLYASDLPVKQKVWFDGDVVSALAPKVQAVRQNTPLLIGLGATSNWSMKTWPQRKFAILVEKLLSSVPEGEVKFVVFGAPHERESIIDLLNYIPEEHLIDLVGKTSLTEAGVWMDSLDVFVGHDSGLSHLAAALDVPTVTLFGPTPHHLYAPVSEKGTLIIAPDRETVNLIPTLPKRIITDIPVEEVYDAVCQHIKHILYPASASDNVEALNGDNE